MARSLDDVRTYVRSVMQLPSGGSFTDAEIDEHIRKAYREVIEFEDWVFLRGRSHVERVDMGSGRFAFPIPDSVPVRRVLNVWEADADGLETNELRNVSYTDGFRFYGWESEGQPVSWSYLPSADQFRNTLYENGLLFMWPQSSLYAVFEYVRKVADWPPNEPSFPQAAKLTGGVDVLPDGLMAALEFLAVANACMQKGDAVAGRSFYSKGRTRLMEHQASEFPTEQVSWARNDQSNQDPYSGYIRTPYRAPPIY